MKPERIPHPILLLVSAPSGAGKTTLCHRLLAEEPGIRYSVSVTTRAPREGEIDGKDYEFVGRDAFERRIGAGDFLEYAEVHGNLYGTSQRRVADLFSAGYSVLLDVDVQGARLIREALEAAGDRNMRPVFHDVFVSPPGLGSLRDRLEGRGKDSSEVIERRLHNAEVEMRSAPDYEFQVVNDDLDDAYDQLRCVYRACCQRTVV